MKDSIRRAASHYVQRLELLNKISRAKSMKDAGYSNVDIAKAMGLNESSVRSLLQPEKEIEEKDEAKLEAMLTRERSDLPNGATKSLRVSFLEGEHIWMVEITTPEANIATMTNTFDEAIDEGRKFLNL